MVNILGPRSARSFEFQPGLWSEWTQPYPKFWRGEGPTRRLAFAPLCMHQYSQTWIDFRGIRDAPMRAAGFDYFENSRRETYANRAWCIVNPLVGRIFKGRVGPQRLRRSRRRRAAFKEARATSWAIPHAGR